MSVSTSIDRLPDTSTIVAKWLIFAGLMGLALQTAWTIHENLSDERYFTHHYIITEADRLLTGATFRDGRFELSNDAVFAPYRGEQAAAYGFRVLDEKAVVLAQANGAEVAGLSPITAISSGLPDFWQRKIGPVWFEVVGGIKRKVGEQDLWIEVMTRGDPDHYRVNALISELFVDVWKPLAPTLALTMLAAIVAVRRALKPLYAVAGLARSIDIRGTAGSFEIRGLPREAAFFVDAINRLIERLEVLRRAQESLIARIVHELRSRLSIVMLELSKISDARARVLEADVAEMSGTLCRLMTIARLEASNGTRRDAEMIHLDRVAATVIAQLLPLAETRSCKLSIVVDRPEPFLGNHAAVMEAVRNVVENAIKHGPDANRVLITCGPGCVTTIDDSGPGLKLSDPQRLFEPFERGETTAEGSGLGLTIVKVAVDLHRGSIEVGRSSLGGVRFVLSFRSLEPDDASLRSQAEEDNETIPISIEGRIA